MAKEYKCVRCGKPAVVHITKITGNEQLTLHFCDECAKKFALDNPNIPANLDPEIKKFEEMAMKKKHKGICPTCGTMLSDLKKGDKFACPDCYSIADNFALDMLRQMHNADRHKGKQPKTHAPNVDTSKIYEVPDLLSDSFIEKLEDVVSNAMETFAAAEKYLPSKSGSQNAEADGAQQAGAEADSAEQTAQNAAPDPKRLDEVSDPAELRKMLDAAIAQERYEDAAKIRDKLNTLKDS